MALRPPKVLRKKDTASEEAPATPAAAPVEEAPKAPPKRTAPPKAKAAKKEAIAKATGQPTKAKRTPKKESAPAEKPVKAKAGPKPATEDAVPELPPIESEHFSGPQIEFGVIIQSMRDSSIADTKGRLELRYVSPRMGVLLNKKVKVPVRGCYSRKEEVDPILDFFRTVPQEFVPTKWLRFLHPSKSGKGAAPKAKAKPAKADAPKAKTRTKKS